MVIQKFCPLPFQLLQLQRPEALPAWKAKKLFQLSKSKTPKYAAAKFLDGTITDSDLMHYPLTTVTISEYQRLSINHSNIITMIPSEPVIRRKLIRRKGEPHDDQTPLSASELRRIKAAAYQVSILYLTGFGFYRYGYQSQDGKLSRELGTLVDYTQLLAFTHREALEAYTFLTHIAKTRNRKTHGIGLAFFARRFCEPLYRILQLKQLILSYVSYEHIVDSKHGFFRLWIKRYTDPNMHDSVFWDSKQPILSRFLDSLDTVFKLPDEQVFRHRQLTSSTFISSQIYLPLRSGAQENDSIPESYITTLNNLFAAYSHRWGGLKLVPVRVDRSGFITTKGDQIVNDVSLDGRWALFSEKDLNKMFTEKRRPLPTGQE